MAVGCVFHLIRSLTRLAGRKVGKQNYPAVGAEPPATTGKE